MIKYQNQSVILSYGANEYIFKLRLGEAKNIQAERKVPFGTFYKRFAAGDWSIEDVVSILFNGLLGGGVKEAKEAQEILNRLVEAFSVSDLVELSTSIILSFYVGVKEDPVGKPQAAMEATAETVTSPSPSSTELEAQLVTPQETSTP